MKYDREITISTGASRKSINWKRQRIKWSEFLEKIRKPTRSLESLDEFLKMPKSQQDDLKDVGGFVGGALKGTRRKAHNVEFRDLISLDFDNIANGQTDDVLRSVENLACSYAVYSTRKHSKVRPRLRIIIPTDRSMTADEYEPIARKIAEKIGIQMADPTTFEASRLMYWPSCSKDSEFVFVYGDWGFLSADDVLKSYEDWRDVSSWPRVQGEDLKQRRLITRQEDPKSKRGLIGAFCRSYNIYSAMDKFIPKAYDPTDSEDRFTYMGGSTTGGAIVYEDGDFLYSHHATDPCGGKLVNAWDLVRLHKFSDLDDGAEEGTPVVKLPSTQAMKDLAKDDEKVSLLMTQERQEEAKDFFEGIGQSLDKEPGEGQNDDQGGGWQVLLTKSYTGDLDKSIANIVTILNCDPNFKGKIYVDEFANRGMVELPLPWEDGEGARMWNDYDDAQLTLRLEKEYGITGREKIENAIKVVGFNNRRNAVKEYILSLEWDGEERIASLLSDFLGADQSIYTEEIMRKSLVAAIARAFSTKGVKFDQMIVFKGPQGIGKSTFLSKLGGEWFNDSLYSFEGKEAAELIQGTLIVEIGELSAMTKSETEVVKQFLSKTHDIYREAYGKRTNKYPRRCVFFGSTNSDEFLKDVTGNRRFWPVSVGERPPKKSIFDDMTEDLVGQIWAEAYYYYLLGEKLILSEEAEEIALAMQENFRERDPKEGMIREFLERPIPKAWYDMTLQEQRSFINGNFKSEEDQELVERDMVCVAEIWQVCLNGDLKYMKRRESLELTNIITGISGWVRNKGHRRYGHFGKQRGFEKVKIIDFTERQNRKNSKKGGT